MLKDKFKEIIDFATSESPYNSANKGWINDDIYLQWGSTKGNSSNQLDHMAKVSFYFDPIIQLLLLLGLVIFISVAVAFTPIALSNGLLG